MKPGSSSVATWLMAGALITWSGCSSGGNGGNTAPINVEVQRAQVEDATQAVSYSGTIEESESIPLSFPVVGIVDCVLVSEGDIVHKGQKLAVLNEESYRNAYEMSLASEKQAEDAYRRLQPMYRNGNLPEVKIIEAESDLQRATSATAIARKNLADCALSSPSDGVVGKRSIDPGMTALPNITSITIVRIGKVFANVPVSEREISSIRKRERATVFVAALDDASFDGSVEEIGILADPLARTYRIRIGIANPAHAIRPGMTCDVRLEHTERVRGVVVAGTAVMIDETGRHYVYLVDSAQSRASRKLVIPGSLLNAGIEILSGLQADDPVVVSGQHKLTDGAPVRVVNIRAGNH